MLRQGIVLLRRILKCQPLRWVSSAGMGSLVEKAEETLALQLSLSYLTEWSGARGLHVFSKCPMTELRLLYQILGILVLLRPGYM